MATEASAAWVDGERFVSDGSSRHAVVFDADREHNSAPGPMEMVLRSLCACSATDLVIILKKTRQAFSGIEVTASGERAAEPPQIYTRIHMEYRVTGTHVDPAVVERAVKLSREKYCSVFVMLSRTAEMDFAIQITEKVAA